MSRPRSSVSRLYPGISRFTPRVTALVAAAILACSLAAVPRAEAYAFEPGNPRWPAGAVTFVLSLGSPSRTLSDGNTSWNAAASPGLLVWNQYMGSLQLSAVINDGTPVSEHDGVNSVAFASTFFGDSFGSNTLAITGYFYSGGQMTEANVLVNNHQSWDSYRGALRFSGGWDLRRVITHEVGHALGLDHPDDYGQHVTAVMNSIVSDTDTAVTDDINGIQAIYGVRSGGATPTPTPTPNPTATPTPTPNPTATPNLRTATVSAAPTFVHTGQSATFTVSVSSSTGSPTTVGYIVGGSAKAGQYSISGTRGSVTIPAGATSTNFTLTVTGRPRRSKSVIIYLANGSGYSLSNTRSAMVTISK